MARLAGVSGSTVRRALKQPYALTPSTLARVQAVLDDLRATSASAHHRAADSLVPATRPAPRPAPTPGTRVQVQRGHRTIRGTVDECMPDGTMLWIWQDHGHGRLLIDPHEDRIVAVSEPSPNQP
ncbi:hypothetical protein [Paenarthrobacter sp. DKR-5]|uniref:hypothetical protein n=1 Tax=Paenarthrobacter sp. DKR-5 TaxID=2835535 RepID=UPI0035B2481F